MRIKGQLRQTLDLIALLNQWLDSYAFPQHKDFEELCRYLVSVAPALNLPVGIFQLDRKKDVSGVSGTGTVAWGINFFEKGVIVGWTGKYKTLTFHSSMESVETIHCHKGATVVCYLYLLRESPPYMAVEEV